MKKHLYSLLIVLLLAGTYNAKALGIIVGPYGGCVGSTGVFTDSAGIAGGTWSSSSPAIATINAATGEVTAISAGTATISLTVGSNVYTRPYQVSTLPAPITGTAITFCAGTTATFSTTTTGGTWGSSAWVASITAAGVATGISAGTTEIRYYAGPGCYAALQVTVTATASDSSTGSNEVCMGGTSVLYNSVSGGLWTSSNTAIATVSSAGIVSGVVPGTALISYTVSGICGSVSTTRTMTVTSTTNTGYITTPPVIAEGNTTLMTGTLPGIWSSSTTTVATISTDGLITGITPGTSVISYTVTGCGGPAVINRIVTVSALNGISGHVILGSTSISQIKVWLIKYEPATHILSAVDSTFASGNGVSRYYQFTGLSTDSFRVKAASYDTMGVTGDYLPTYHTSSPYWHSASVIYHNAGSADMNKDITMGIGTPTTGPGFIAGDVTMGANKGTSGTIPSVGLLIYAQDNTTGAIMQQTKTNAAGHYSFSNLPVGTYRVYPELLNYATTPYSAISLTTASPSMAAASFEQHTVSYKITPITEAVGNVATSASYISAFPNPTSGKLNISYKAAAAEQGDVNITDVTGRTVYTTTINMQQGAGTTALDLSSLSNGLYIISIKSASVNYNSKVQIQK